MEDFIGLIGRWVGEVIVGRSEWPDFGAVWYLCLRNWICCREGNVIGIIGSFI